MIKIPSTEILDKHAVLVEKSYDYALFSILYRPHPLAPFKPVYFIAERHLDGLYYPVSKYLIKSKNVALLMLEVRSAREFSTDVLRQTYVKTA